MLNKGDIVEVYFDLPYKKETKTHPGIIISNQDVYNVDDMYICVMMSSTERIDKMTFEITQEMLNMPSKKRFSQVRSHIISYIHEDHILNNKRPINSLKPLALKKLMIYINENVFE